MKEPRLTNAQAFGFLSETDMTIEQEASIAHLQLRIRAMEKHICHLLGAPDFDFDAAYVSEP